MSDKYSNFKSLSEIEKKDLDFSIFIKNMESRITIVAPHGGSIEPGTSEIAKSIANDKYNCYCFEGIKTKNNKDFLHITSTNFDEPECIALIQSSDIVVTIHGADNDDELIFVGGLEEEFKRSTIKKLKNVDLEAKEDNTEHSGRDISNLCNKGSLKKGLQLEISHGLRIKMFKGLKREDRKFTTEIYDKFIEAIQFVLEEGA